MTPLVRALIEKLGHNHGFEYVLPEQQVAVCSLGSARHPAKVAISCAQMGYVVNVTHGPSALAVELERSFARWPRLGEAYLLSTEADLAHWLQRASVLAQSLPNQAAVDFEAQVQQALAALPSSDARNTEVIRMVRQRVGQDRYRQAMLSYWGGACAITGLALPAALRASHAKPWADCSTDAERLDVFNGFLLSANLDALFDQFLLTFGQHGEVLVASHIGAEDRSFLGLSPNMGLRWLAPQHLPYLDHHRACFLATQHAQG